MNLQIRGAERDVIVRGIVAFALIIAILIAAVASARAEPAAGRDDLMGMHAAAQVRLVHVGAGRPAVCPRLWCGCWARLQVGIKDPAYNRALAWLHFHHVPKRVGAWAVMRRRGGGHVGRVVAIDASGNPVIVSGNHSHRVGVATYPKGRVVAYVEPSRGEM